MAENVQTTDATPTDLPPPSTEPAPDLSPEPAAAPAAPPAEPANLGTAPADPLPQAVPATWPEDWRQQFAGKNDDDLKTLSRFKDPATLWSSHKSLRAKLSSGDLLPVRPDVTDEKAMTEWRAQAGVPETAEGYYEALSKDTEIAEADKPFLDDYFQRMHAKGVAPADVAEGVNAYYDTLAKEFEARGEEDTKQMHATEEGLRGQLGPEYSIRMDHMRDTLFGDNVFLQAPRGLLQRFFGARLEDGTALGNDPEVMNWMLDLAGVVNPDIGHTLTPVSGGDPSASLTNEIAAIELEMHDTKGREPGGYWNSPEKQARLRQLYDIQEKQQARGR